METLRRVHGLRPIGCVIAGTARAVAAKACRTVYGFPIGRFLFALMLAFLATACQRDVFDSYTVGFATPSGNRIWVQDATFDGKWGVPAGSMAGRWQGAGKSESVFNKPMPHKLHIQWLQEERNLVHAATVQLPDDLGDRPRQGRRSAVATTNAEHR